MEYVLYSIFYGEVNYLC